MPDKVILGPDGQLVDAKPDPVESHRRVCPVCRRRAKLRGRKVWRAVQAITVAEDQHLMACQICAELTANDRPFYNCAKLSELVRMRIDEVGKMHCPRGRELIRQSAVDAGLVGVIEASLEQLVDDELPDDELDQVEDDDVEENSEALD